MAVPLVASVATTAASNPSLWGNALNVGKNLLGKATNVADIFSNWASGSGKNLLNFGGKGLNYLGGLIGGNQETSVAKAYQDYLNGVAGDMQNQLGARADKYDNKLQGQFNQAEPQFQAEAYTQLPELGQLVEDIANQSAEAQRQNQRQINASLARQGVRGGQAAILANRATGELNRDLQRDINKTIYDEAANRQSARLDYYGKKALTPWTTMSSAYGNSMVGANNALSDAQGFTYKNAYNRAMENFGSANKKKSWF